ncbi:MAG: hypothetical protein ACTHJS_15485, partial [Xanthobacteraceae bacterium]
RACPSRHSGARALAREPGIHSPRAGVMDSGLATSWRSGMTHRFSKPGTAALAEAGAITHLS